MRRRQWGSGANWTVGKCSSEAAGQRGSVALGAMRRGECGIKGRKQQRGSKAVRNHNGKPTYGHPFMSRVP